MSRTVAVIGPSTFVGTVLVPRLLDGGHRVVGVSPRAPIARIFLPEESEAFTVATPDEARALIAESPEVSIVNLAEISDVPSQELLARDKRTRALWRRRLAATIAALAPRGAQRLIHVSSASVFGPAPAEPPAPARVRWRPMEDAEAESQLLTEHMMERVARKLGCEPSIVRLGNPIGPGSPVWVAELAQRVMEMQPVGYAGEEGFSNATHVANAADYIAELVERGPEELCGFGSFHHVAEFSARRWPELLDVMSAVVGIPWAVASRASAPEPRSPGLVAKRTLKAGYRSTPGAYLRAGVAMLPDWRLLERLPRGGAPPPPEIGGSPQAAPGDAALLEMLSARHEFKSHTVAGWQPKLGFSAACDGIAQWLHDSGYRLVGGS